MERGYWCFNAPVGYRYEKTKEHGKLIVPIHRITDILTAGLTAFAEDRLLTQLDLLLYLRQSRLPALLKGQRISFNFVKTILVQPLYAGRIVYPPWMVTARPGKHRAIITVETFEKIQTKLQRPPRLPRATDSLEFPLRRIIRCAVCGKPLTGSSCKGKREYYPYYTCNNTACAASPKNIAAGLVENQYIALLESIKADAEVLEAIKQTVRHIWQRRIARRAQDQSHTQNEISALRKEIRGYVNLMPSTKSETVRATYEAKIDELSASIESLEKELQHTTIPNFDEALSLALTFIGTPATCWQNADVTGKRLLHSLIFQEPPRYSRKTGFGTPILTPPFHIIRYHHDRNDNLVHPPLKFWNTFVDAVLDWADALKVVLAPK